eukprot:SAG11_NODE_1255_length_5375_cov_2.966641_8_plen_240_part_00
MWVRAKTFQQYARIERRLSLRRFGAWFMATGRVLLLKSAALALGATAAFWLGRYLYRTYTSDENQQRNRARHYFRLYVHEREKLKRRRHHELDPLEDGVPVAQRKTPRLADGGWEAENLGAGAAAEDPEAEVLAREKDGGGDAADFSTPQHQPPMFLQRQQLDTQQHLRWTPGEVERQLEAQPTPRFRPNRYQLQRVLLALLQSAPVLLALLGYLLSRAGRALENVAPVNRKPCEATSV